METYSFVAYEKGYQFLAYLESLTGEIDFQKFVNKWLVKFSYQSADVDDFKVTFEAFLYEMYTSTKAKDIIKKIDWNTWITGPGLPPVTANFTTDEEKTAFKLADDYLSGKEKPAGYEKYTTWPTIQKLLFFN